MEVRPLEPNMAKHTEAYIIRMRESQVMLQGPTEARTTNSCLPRSLV